MTDEAQNQMVEPFVVPDTYVNGLGEVEYVGGGDFRFTFFSLQHGERVAVAKLVCSAETVPAAAHMALSAVVERQLEKVFTTWRGSRH